MHRPIAVFDAGIGSYAVVAEIRKRLPQQDILYFADRASFPYGGKTRADLLAVMRRTINYLAEFNPSAIVIASNAPSIMVLEELSMDSHLPLFGVYPPLREAWGLSHSGQVGIMGVQSLVESPMISDYVAENSAFSEQVALINASAMVELVETGAFLFAPQQTQTAVDAFLHDVFIKYPDIDVLTLSSTHLPWLRPFFEAARPRCHFLDPAKDMVARIGEGTKGQGKIRALVTEDERYDLETFRRMLQAIGVDIPLESVRPY
ncbi:glutamate racemase [Pseudochrobactrum sp. MP213Fo]|uniref:glutamate racemase n=1 Tax=Pseudochrobactrum sp. MP213Fo TaxID=3022250 RepID=UPI003B9EAE05